MKGWDGTDRTTSKAFMRISPNSVILIEKNLWKTWGNHVIPSDYNDPSYTNNISSAYHDEWGATFRHNGHANFLFKDGHATLYKLGQQFSTNWIPE
jgi:prepilin-type processing-associated H-X9-DG protein